MIFFFYKWYVKRTERSIPLGTILPRRLCPHLQALNMERKHVAQAKTSGEMNALGFRTTFFYLQQGQLHWFTMLVIKKMRTKWKKRTKGNETILEPIIVDFLFESEPYSWCSEVLSADRYGDKIGANVTANARDAIVLKCLIIEESSSILGSAQSEFDSR